jgi:drug/metabolite transporter (DMT)-like permease
MPLKQLCGVFILAALWGASFLFMRVASPVLGPVFLIDARVIIAAAVLFVFSKVVKNDFSFRAHWKQYLFLGAVNSAIPFTLIATATLQLTASLAAILNSMVPLFTAIIASIWLKEKLSKQKLLGIILGLTGVVIIVGWNPISTDIKIIAFAGLSVTATFFYGIGNVYARKNCGNISSLNTTLGQFIGASILLLPAAILKFPGEWPSLKVIFALVGLAVFCTSLAFILYFYLIKSAGSTRAASTLFLVPVFGTLWGVLLLDEAINISALVGLAIILAGISLIYQVPIIEKVKSIFSFPERRNDFHREG